MHEGYELLFVNQPDEVVAKISPGYVYKGKGVEAQLKHTGDFPKSPNEIVNVDHRLKLKENCGRIKTLHSRTMRVSREWAFLSGYYVVINQIPPNKVGYTDVALAERKRMQVNVFCCDRRAEGVFIDAFLLSKKHERNDLNMIVGDVDEFHNLFHVAYGDGQSNVCDTVLKPEVSHHTPSNPSASNSSVSESLEDGPVPENAYSGSFPFGHGGFI